MVCIYKNELIAAKGCDGMGLLSSDSGDSKGLSTALNTFMTTPTSYIQGQQWIVVKDKVQIYIDLLSARNSMASNLFSAMNDALSTLIDYMGPYEMLDNSKAVMDEVNANIIQASSIIGSLRAKLDGLEEDDPSHATINVSIIKANNTLEELKTYLEYLEGLGGVYNAAESKIESAHDSCKSYYDKVVGITPTPKISYQKI